MKGRITTADNVIIVFLFMIKVLEFHINTTIELKGSLIYKKNRILLYICLSKSLIYGKGKKSSK